MGKLKIYVPLLLVLFVFLYSCEKDDYTAQEDESINFPKLSGSIITVDDLSHNPRLKDKILALSQNSFKKSGAGGIQIDTSRIEVMQSSAFTSYTFQIVQDSIEKQSILRNYVITMIDTLEIQHLVSYPVLGPRDYDMDNIDFQQVWGDSLITQTRFKCGGTVTQWYTYEDCYVVNCNGTIGGQPANHGLGDICTASRQAYINCVNTWAYFTYQEEPCASLDTGNPGNGGGGIPGDVPPPPDDDDSDDDNADERNVTIGLSPNDGLSPVDPLCSDVAKRFNEQDFADKIEELEGKTDENKEFGYVESSANNFDPVESATNFSSLSVAITNTTTVGMMHTHMDDFARGPTDPNTGMQPMNELIRIHSPGDIQTFLSTVRKAAANNIDLKKVYLTMVSSTGTYTLKYDGNASNIPSGLSVNNLNPEQLEDKYIDIINDFGRQRGLLKFMKDELGITNFSLYKTKSNGKIQRLFLEGAKDKLKKETCYEN